MPAEISKIPTPNEWVEGKLREQKMSNAALARIIGHDRTQVQRWINGREQIPRHHLAEIAIQLGSYTDLEYALKLKECEDSTDTLKRRIRELSRVPTSLRRTTRTVSNILRRLLQPEQYASIRELDTFRLREILRRCTPESIPDVSLEPKIRATLAQPLASNRNKYTTEAEALLNELVDNLNLQHLK
jgi:plasmid maintenance system antidote protein VapI